MNEPYENFSSSTADPGTGRRTVLKGLAAGTVGLTGIAGTAAAQGTKVAADERALYVWGYAPVLATDGAARERFIERTDRFGIDTVYLSWGALRSASPAAIGGLSEAAHAAGLAVHAMTGAYGLGATDIAREVVGEVRAHNDEYGPDAGFDGLHLNLECAPGDLRPFLESLVALLDERPSIAPDLEVSATVAWWWALPDYEPALARAVAAHPALAASVIMAYWDEPEEVRRRLATIVEGLDAPHLLAIETQEFPGGASWVTTYEEGWSGLRTIEEAIAADPPGGGYGGIAIHYYESGLAAWDALRNARFDRETARPRDRVAVEATVVFDDTFPASAHESDLTVVFDGPKRYTATTTVTPPSNEPVTASVEWHVPHDAPAGEYAVRATLSDPTVENGDREAVGRRAEPVVLGERDLGTLSVLGRGRPGR
ncbi:hypothetical protein [Saliphagus infecundisoli]|uniref:Uncharacterized protein n=1 Tax=Saliphagus infecundisoli TaxID=1849069 RepID=A0ABD5QFI1_9EURY|nr:hypothetical protein [Saliphagus infecundisoli]